MANTINVLLWNCRGILSKHTELHKLSQNREIIILTETWLQSNKQLHLNGYSTIRADRQGSRGGGVACLIKNPIRYQHIPIDNQVDNHTQVLAIHLLTSPEPVNLVVIYRPPGSSLKYQQWKPFLANLCLPGSTIIAGDLNANHPAWNSEREDNAGSSLLKVIQENNLFIHNTDTKSHIGSPGQRNNNLDLILFTMDIAHLIVSNQLDDSHGSDHFPIETQILHRSPFLRRTYKLSTKKT
ncbi:RNA-directed DNA polymerase from mobile element jockey [Anthophora plagiata]